MASISALCDSAALHAFDGLPEHGCQLPGQRGARTRACATRCRTRFGSSRSFQPSTLLPSPQPESAARSVRRSALTARLSYGPSVARLSTEIGGEYLDDTRRRADLFVSTSQPASTSSSFRSQERAVLSGMVRQSAVFSDRVRVDAGVRRDSFKRGFSRVDDPTYPFGGAAVDIVRSDEHANRVISSLTVRAAYGESGDQRAFESALDFRYAIPLALPPRVPLTVPRHVERTRETEAGIDLGLLRDRVRLGATFFNARTSEALTPTSGFGTAGGFTMVTADGAWRNRGTEIALHTQIIATASAKAALDVTVTHLDNEVLSTGLDTVFGRYTLSLRGFPLSGFWGLPFTVTDANTDGVIVPAEVTTDLTQRYLGSATPTREIGIIPSVKLGKSVSMAALIDYRGGFSTLNLTGFIRCASRCSTMYLPTASLFEQARSMRGAETLSGWVEDASFIKLREVTLSWNAPASWGRRIGAHAPRFTIAGRNLVTLTDYSGLDPETSYTGQSTIDQREAFTPPLARTVTLRLDLGW
jgi:TonB-dependent starch-binding outer membrane protein SusC